MIARVALLAGLWIASAFALSAAELGYEEDRAEQAQRLKSSNFVLSAPTAGLMINSPPCALALVNADMTVKIDWPCVDRMQRRCQEQKPPEQICLYSALLTAARGKP